MKRFPMFRGLVFALLALAVLLSLIPAGAKTKLVRYSATKTYETAETLFSALGAQDPTCDSKGKNCHLAQDGYADVGSVTFPPIGGIGKVNLQVTIKDSLNLASQVNADVCQDTNANNTCGDTGDAEIRGCFVAGKPKFLGGVDRGLPVIAFIHAVWGCPTYLVPDIADSQAIATSGTVTLSGLIPASSPVTMKTIRHTFASTIPCAEACSFNSVNPGNQTTQDARLACTAPGPSGSYADLVVTAPPGANQIYITQTPQVQWSLYLCAKPASGNNGSYITQSWTDPHCQAAGLVGCKTTMSAPVVPGRRYVVRNFNFDEPPGATIASTILFRRV